MLAFLKLAKVVFEVRQEAEVVLEVIWHDTTLLLYVLSQREPQPCDNQDQDGRRGLARAAALQHGFLRCPGGGRLAAVQRKASLRARCRTDRAHVHAHVERGTACALADTRQACYPQPDLQ